MSLVRKTISEIDKKHELFEKLFSDEDGSKLLSKTLFYILVFAVTIATSLFLFNIYLVSETDKGGVFGDFFGGVLNPIFTFLTLFGLIVTIVIQRQELRLARIEYEKTANALTTQAIENTFFSLIELHHKIVDDIEVDLREIVKRSPASELAASASTIVAGIAGIKVPSQESRNPVFNGRVAFDEILDILVEGSKSPDEVKTRYIQLQTNHNHILGHYFRNLYQALKLIHEFDDKDITQEDRKKYASILRAQLSTKELALIFLNCLEGVCDQGQFKNLLVEYEMLEHLPIKDVQDGYSLAQSKGAVASMAMLEEYIEPNTIFKLRPRYATGAFGYNSGLPHNISPNKKRQADA